MLYSCCQWLVDCVGWLEHGAAGVCVMTHCLQLSNVSVRLPEWTNLWFSFCLLNEMMPLPSTQPSAALAWQNLLVNICFLLRISAARAG